MTSSMHRLYTWLVNLSCLTTPAGSSERVTSLHHDGQVHTKLSKFVTMGWFVSRTWRPWQTWPASSPTDSLSRTLLSQPQIHQHLPLQATAQTRPSTLRPVGQNVYKWMPYRPLDGIQPNVQVSTPAAGCIYLSNIDCHFQPVLKVWRSIKPYSVNMYVVSHLCETIYSIAKTPWFTSNQQPYIYKVFLV